MYQVQRKLEFTILYSEQPTRGDVELEANDTSLVLDKWRSFQERNILSNTVLNATLCKYNITNMLRY